MRWCDARSEAGGVSKLQVGHAVVGEREAGSRSGAVHVGSFDWAAAALAHRRANRQSRARGRPAHPDKPRRPLKLHPGAWCLLVHSAASSADVRGQQHSMRAGHGALARTLAMEPAACVATPALLACVGACVGPADASVAMLNASCGGYSLSTLVA